MARRSSSSATAMRSSRSSTLEAAGLRDFGGRRETVDGEERVSLASLAPRVRFQSTRAPCGSSYRRPELLGVVVRDLDAGAPAGLVYRSAPSAFLNYAASAGTGSRLRAVHRGGHQRPRRVVLHARRPGRRRDDSRVEQPDDRSTLAPAALGDRRQLRLRRPARRRRAGRRHDRRPRLQPGAVLRALSDACRCRRRCRCPRSWKCTSTDVSCAQEQVQPGRIDVRNLPMSSGQQRYAPRRCAIRSAARGRSRRASTSRARCSRAASTTTSTAIGWRRQSLGTASWDYQRAGRRSARHRVGPERRHHRGIPCRGRAWVDQRRAVVEPARAGRRDRGRRRREPHRGSGGGSRRRLSYMYIGRPRQLRRPGVADRERATRTSASASTSAACRNRSLNVFGSVPVGGGSTLTLQHNEIVGTPTT